MNIQCVVFTVILHNVKQVSSMIKRDVLNLFLKTNKTAINECTNGVEQQDLYKRFLSRLHSQGTITLEQLIKWS